MIKTIDDVEKQVLAIAFKDEKYMIELLIDRANLAGFPNSQFNDVLDLAESLIGRDKKANRIYLKTATEDQSLKAYISSIEHDVILSNWEYFKNKLLEEYRIRKIKKIAQNLADNAEKLNIEATINELENIYTERKASQFTHISEVVQNVFTSMEDIATTKNKYLSTGFPSLDKYLCGIPLGALVVVAARPSKGKTSLGLSLASRMSKLYDCLFFSIEMSKHELGTSLCANETQRNFMTIRSNGFLNDKTKEVVKAGVNSLSRRKLQICDDGEIDINKLNQMIKQQKFLNPNLKCIFVDYIGIMPYSNPKQTEYQALSEITKTLKQIAIKNDIVIFALAQLNRKVEDTADKIPNLASLRGSGSIEQDANQVWFIHHPEQEEGAGLIVDTDIIIAKNRGGRTGSIRLTFDKGSTRFYDPEE